ncbi:TPA: hypothetical protein N0F65_007021 [Lagenidium giganteum]|uniref:Uncharacterized protein n=1 Tax=Lagenidium giganteum TaxID=4803 RepID=A0AAV2YV23_9STRA|nr:TPA: hypothetical protein N0F65_007021 [Lagenidium giganteum]
MGGQRGARRLWREQLATADGVVFVLDAARLEHFSKAKSELHVLLTSDVLRHAVFVVLGNQCDKAAAQALDWQKHAYSEDGSKRPIELFMCSALRRQGYIDGFHWMANALANQPSRQPSKQPSTLAPASSWRWSSCTML